MSLGAGAGEVLERFLAASPPLAALAVPITAAAELLTGCWAGGGSVYTCGNGGSHADALHIAGELVKSFERPRPLDRRLVDALLAAPSPYGEDLLGGLQAGLRTFALGANGAVVSAIANDIATPHIGLAQELSALGRPGDVLWALSTSGTSRSVLLAATVARAIGMPVIGFTGLGRRDSPEHGTELAALADVAVVAPARETADVQGWHVRIYHCLCGMIEVELFGE